MPDGGNFASRPSLKRASVGLATLKRSMNAAYDGKKHIILTSDLQQQIEEKKELLMDNGTEDEIKLFTEKLNRLIKPAVDSSTGIVKENQKILSSLVVSSPAGASAFTAVDIPVNNTARLLELIRSQLKAMESLAYTPNCEKMKEIGQYLQVASDVDLALEPVVAVLTNIEPFGYDATVRVVIAGVVRPKLQAFFVAIKHYFENKSTSVSVRAGPDALSQTPGAARRSPSPTASGLLRELLAATTALSAEIPSLSSQLAPVANSLHDASGMFATLRGVLPGMMRFMMNVDVLGDARLSPIAALVRQATAPSRPTDGALVQQAAGSMEELLKISLASEIKSMMEDFLTTAVSETVVAWQQTVRSRRILNFSPVGSLAVEGLRQVSVADLGTLYLEGRELLSQTKLGCLQRIEQSYRILVPYSGMGVEGGSRSYSPRSLELRSRWFEHLRSSDDTFNTDFLYGQSIEALHQLASEGEAIVAEITMQGQAQRGAIAAHRGGTAYGVGGRGDLALAHAILDGMIAEIIEEGRVGPAVSPRPVTPVVDVTLLPSADFRSAFMSQIAGEMNNGQAGGGVSAGFVAVFDRALESAQEFATDGSMRGPSGVGHLYRSISMPNLGGSGSSSRSPTPPLQGAQFMADGANGYIDVGSHDGSGSSSRGSTPPLQGAHFIADGANGYIDVGSHDGSGSSSRGSTPPLQGAHFIADGANGYIDVGSHDGSGSSSRSPTPPPLRPHPTPQGAGAERRDAQFMANEAINDDRQRLDGGGIRRASFCKRNWPVIFVLILAIFVGLMFLFVWLGTRRGTQDKGLCDPMHSLLEGVVRCVLQNCSETDFQAICAQNNLVEDNQHFMVQPFNRTCPAAMPANMTGACPYVDPDPATTVNAVLKGALKCLVEANSDFSGC